MCVTALKQAEKGDPSSHALRLEIQAMNNELNHLRAQSGSDRRAEVYARIGRFHSFGLSLTVSELLYHAGVMLWDEGVKVSLGIKGRRLRTLMLGLRLAGLPSLCERRFAKDISESSHSTSETLHDLEMRREATQ